MNRFQMACASIFLAASLAPGHAASIDFEEGGAAPCSFASQEPLDTEYAGLGVTFGGGWEILDQCGNFGIGARSGNNFAAYNTGVSGVTDTLSATFSFLVSQVSGYLGDGVNSSWTITGFLNNAMAAQQVIVNAPSNYAMFQLTGTFDRITVQGSGDHAVMDDFSFRAAVIPLPAALPLLATGLGFLGLWSRRRRKSA